MIEAPASPVLAAALRWIKRGAAPIPVRFKAKGCLSAKRGRSSGLRPLTCPRFQCRAAQPRACSGASLPVTSSTLISTGRKPVRSPRRCCRPRRSTAVQAASHRIGSTRSPVRRRQPSGRCRRRWCRRAPRRAWSSCAPTARRAWSRRRRTRAASSTPGIVSAAPQVIEHLVLLRKLNLIASGALLVQFWREGVRHQIALALSGATLSAGYTAEEVATLITASPSRPVTSRHAIAPAPCSRARQRSPPASQRPACRSWPSSSASRPWRLLKKWLGARQCRAAHELEQQHVMGA